MKVHSFMHSMTQPPTDLESGTKANASGQLIYQFDSRNKQSLQIEVPSKGVKVPSAAKFLFLCVGVVVFFILCSYIEELTFRNIEGFHYSAFLTVYELFGFAVFAIIHGLIAYDPSQNADSKLYKNALMKKFAAVTQVRAPASSYAVIALSMTIARLLTNGSLEFLNYPTQVVFKSLKLPVVMIGSLLMFSKSYSCLDYSSAFLLALSAALFSLGDSEVSPSFSTVGIAMVLFSLVGDAIHSNIQEMVLRKHRASNEEMMLWTNFFGGLLALIGITFTGELFSALSFFAENKWLYSVLGIRTLVVYLGVLCIVEMIRDFGVVVATFVTTMRKVMTISFSFFMFPKPFSYKYGIAVFLFASGLLLKLLDDRQKKNKPQKQKSTSN